MKWDRTSHEFNFSQISKLSWKGSHSPRSCFNLLKRLQARVNGLITWDEERERGGTYRVGCCLGGRESVAFR